MSSYLAQIGRSVNLTLAELRSIYAVSEVFSNEFVQFQTKLAPSINQLGSTPKVAEIIEDLDNPQDLFSRIKQIIISTLPNKQKLNLAISNYSDYNLSSTQLLRLKKQLSQRGMKVRLVLPTSGKQALTNTQTFHNKLDQLPNLELLIIRSNNKFFLAKTIGIQNPNLYSLRDYHKPGRDSKVGMLPPKLAQIMINLAQPGLDDLIYDPFCGTGTINIEASLLGLYNVGSDNSKAVLELAKQNLTWLFEQKSLVGLQPNPYRPVTESLVQGLDLSDATTKQSLDQLNFKGRIKIVSEGYLGKNFESHPNLEQILEQKSNLESIYSQVLTLWSKDTRIDRIVICTPNWQLDNQSISLGLIDQIKDLGYNLLKFGLEAANNQLIYGRPGQFVRRELLVLEKSNVKN
ncbi:hypothetical protein KA531_01355 [Candidatus Saccharibacteria bacterium]|nr:hypothetical protein [Candidatus Saccharibacteria bacterium]